MNTNLGAPTPPIELTPEDGAPITSRLVATRVEVTEDVGRRLAEVCGEVVVDDPSTLAEAGRDWWPLALQWALAGEVPALPGLVARPASATEVADVLRVCSAAGVPVTPAAGRSGVCGASVPVHGGVALDLTSLRGLVDVDGTSLITEVLPGTFGDVLEDELRRDHGVTMGHWPQSMALSTVGGWLACRSAGQFSTRYGKIEDMVVGLEVALADGSVITTGGAPRAAVGPDLNQLFVGSEGTLGIITRAWLRVHPVPPVERRAAFAFASFVEGLDACRRVLRRGATPAVLRLYDPTEADRSYSTGDRAALLVLDEGDLAIVDATMAIVAEECEAVGAELLDVELVERWMGHRNDVSALQGLTRKGFVVDTMEVSGPWSVLPAVYEAGVEALLGIDGMLAASAHQSHSYLDGACLYFTFAARPEPDQREALYVAAWDAASRAVLGAGGSLSHHHGIGLNRSRFVGEALGGGLGVLRSVKAALDPAGVLNPGKLGLPSPFGEVPWPRPG